MKVSIVDLFVVSVMGILAAVFLGLLVVEMWHDIRDYAVRRQRTARARKLKRDSRGE